MKTTILGRLVAFVLCVLTATAGQADSWAPPTQKTYVSESGNQRIVVVPAPLDSALQYFRDELEAERSNKQVKRPAPLAYWERRSADNGWDPVVVFELANAIAPVGALVAEKTGRLVTLDNWHSVGFGENVVVIYDQAGLVLRSLRLSDIVPQNYIDALPRSVSSVSWRRGTTISSDGQFLELEIVIPEVSNEKPRTVKRLIALADGTVLPGGQEWSAALASAERVAADKEAAAAAHLDYLRSPLVAPTGCDRSEWHSYLREAFARLTPNYLDWPVANVTVVHPPEEPTFEKSLGWLAEDLSDAAEYPDEMAVAAPCGSAAFAQALRPMLAGLGDGALSGSTLYLATDAVTLEQVAAMLAGTGIRLVPLDTSRAIPQRPERVPGSEEKRIADLEIERRQRAEMDAAMEALED